MSTVSRALNNCHDVSAKTRENILEIAKDLGYFQRKKRIKRENRKKNEFNIALICPEIQSSYYSNIVLKISNELAKYNCRCVVYNFAFDRYERDRLFDICGNADNIDAIVCIDQAEPIEYFKETPIIVIEGDGVFYNVIETGMKECFKSFKERCYSTVFFVGETFTKKRETVFADTAKIYPDIKTKKFVADSRFEEAGREAGAFFLKKEELPNAVVCAYDEIALGLIEFFNENNINVPSDVSVIGINDIPTAKYCFGGLSTISCELDSVCRTFVKDLVDDIKNGCVVARKYRVPSHFIRRNT